MTAPEPELSSAVPARFPEAPPLTLYIHVPWCVRKCPYCDFNSHATQEPLPERAYVRALLDDLRQEAPQLAGRPVKSIFIGGGTPSLLTPGAYEELLSGIAANLALTGDAEITLEANPGTVERTRFAGFRAAGINRLSIGIQSFDDEQLRQLGRIHSGAEARQAAHTAHATGFDNFNLDLMHALPGQTPEQAAIDLRSALELAPAHLSWYQLTLEPNTRFYRFPPSLPDEDTVAAIQECGQALLADAGFRRYEISAYARPGRSCRHNLNYWQFGDYAGIGAGAHGKITCRETGRVRRYAKRRGPLDYMEHAHKAARVSRSWSLDAEDLRLEFMMNALRLTDGFERGLFTARTGLDERHIERGVKKAQAAALLVNGPGAHLGPTELGLSFLNDLLQVFMDEQ